MVTREQARDAPGMPATGAASEDQSRFTGVVLIHGLGPIRRNGMLEQSLNALSYWFNHEAGLALRPEGPGRYWLDAKLTDDPDPDVAASRASVDVVAPGATDSGLSTDAAVRLEFREVWWAESFGLPNIGQTITWARVQVREQASRLLIPIGRRIGPAHTASQAPAREIAQALTYRPPAVTRPDSRPATAGAPPPAAASAQVSRPVRWALRSALFVYDVFQYLWKAAQWLILTPAIALLLIVMGIVRVFAIIPFLRPAIVASFTAITDNIMLHWVAEVQVYLTDYTRSSAIRQRFEREAEEFLRDPRCDRIVVIAESGGTYIAYEGLTTLLAKPDLPHDAQGNPKPVTFVSIATALRRIWLLADSDPHRVHGVLPEYVRWLHFWARYDPVAAGPLTTDSIRPIARWDDPNEPSPYDKIVASLERCENVDVANTDSTFTDHVGYWDNLEQVVGPLAHELVAGHPLLEQTVKDHLASRDAVLLRRWSVAWRYSLAFAGGLAAGLGLLVWSLQHPAFSEAITGLLQRVDWGGIVDSVCAPCKAFTGNPVAQLPPNATVDQVGQYLRAQAVTYLITHFVTAQVLVVGTLAVVVMGVTNLLIAKMAAKPTPFAFPTTDVPVTLRLGWLFAVTACGVVLVFVASIIFSAFVPKQLSLASISQNPFGVAYIWALGLGELAYAVSVLAALVATLQQRQWGWVIGLILSLSLLTTFDPFYRGAMLAVAVVGCVVWLSRPIDRRESVRKAAIKKATLKKVALAIVAVTSVDAGIGVTLFDFKIARTPLLGAGVFVEFLLPMLIYAIWAGGPKPSTWNRPTAPRQVILIVATLYLALLTALAVPYVITRTGLYGHVYDLSSPLHALSLGGPSQDVLRATGVALAVLFGGLLLLLSVVDAVRTRHWIWLVGTPFVLGGMTAGLAVLAQIGVKSTQPEAGLVLSYVLAGTALIYTLWAGPPRRQGRMLV